MSLSQLHIFRCHPDAIVPTRGSANAAGLDLYACEDGLIPKGKHVMIPTGIKMAIPQGYYGRVAPRSGLAAKHGIDVFAGVIDSDYRGEVRVILFNSSNEYDFVYHKGERIAQLIIEAHYNFPVNECKEEDELQKTDRGEGGFGSTGMN